MNIRTFILVSLFLGFQGLALAQGPSKRSVEERVAAVHELFESNFRFDAAKLNRIDEIFSNFYLGQDRIRENIQAPPSSGLVQGLVAQDFQSVRRTNDNNIAERDNRLRRVLSADEFRKWQEELEPMLRSPRRRH